MHGFLKAVKLALRIEAFKFLVSSHSDFLGFPDGGVGIFAADSQVTAGAGIPPEDQGVRVVRIQADMKIDRDAIGQVVVVQADGSL